MGPVRRIALLALLWPSAALAEVCEVTRPLWTPGSPATVFTEALNLIASPLSILLLAATGLALRYRSSWGGVVVVLLWTGFSSLIVFAPPDEIQQQALKEGCIGSPALFIALVLAICVGTILYTAPRKERA